MSAAIAAARKRRAPASAQTTESASLQSVNTQSANTQPSGLTLPQVIALVDRRLIALEQHVKTQQETPAQKNETVVVESTANLDAIVEEFNSRYTILAEEIENIKNIVLNLQSYTMEVNKTLLEERVRVLSDIEHPTQTLKIDNSRASFSADSKIEYLEEGDN